MKQHLKSALVAACVLSALTACGKKEDSTNSTAPAAESSASLYKQTEKFGSVSNIVLTPRFDVPSKYSSYIRQEATELNKDEYAKYPDAAFEAYVNTWIKQAASVDKPDWQMLAGILHPEITAETNEFKKQEAADKAKTEIAVDKKQLGVVYGWQGEMLYITGPDVSNGEYYLLIRPDSRYQIVSYQTEKNYRYNLSYKPNFKALGMTGDHRGDMQFTVKVPIEKAKEIESLRENSKAMIRVYGQVSGVSQDRFPMVRKDFSEAGLSIDVEAIEIGSRQNGQFKPYFFLDTDQLKRSKM